MAKLHIHPIGLGLIFFGLLSWVVALGGLAASTKFCNDNRPTGTSTSYCANTYQMEWWAIWFEFCLLVVMLATCFLPAFERARFIYLSYLSMVTVLLTFTAKNFITNSFIVGGINLQDYKADAYNAAAAGCVLLCISNFALIIFIGLGAHTYQSTQANYAATEVKYQPSNF